MKDIKATELKSTTLSYNHTQNLTQSKLFYLWNFKSNIHTFTSWPSRLHYPSSPYCLLFLISTSSVTFSSYQSPIFILISTQSTSHGEHSNPDPAHRLSSLAPTKSWILPTSPLLGSYIPFPRENTTITQNNSAINSWFPTSTGLLLLLAEVSLSVFSLILHNDQVLFLKTLTHYYSRLSQDYTQKRCSLSWTTMLHFKKSYK